MSTNVALGTAMMLAVTASDSSPAASENSYPHADIVLVSAMVLGFLASLLHHKVYNNPYGPSATVGIVVFFMILMLGLIAVDILI